MGSINPLGNLSSATSSQSGIGAGIDVQNVVSELMSIENQPLQLLQVQQQTLNVQTSALRDVNAKLLDLQTQINALSGTSGAFSATTASSSQSALVGITANSSAATGNHTVSVTNLATTSSTYTNYDVAIPDGNSTFATGSFDLQVGSAQPVTVAVDSTNNTLNGLANSINSLHAGVTANVITDANGARLSIVSDTSGSPGNITISNNSTALSFAAPIAGTNAALTVDGVPIVSATNTVDGVIPGVTLTLYGSTNNPVSVSVQQDTSRVQAAVNNFVSSYNTVIKAINAQFNYDQTTQQAGILAGDGGLRDVQEQLLGQITYSISGNNGIGSLADLGVSMADDGTLSVDSSKLSEALSNNYSDVQNFFQTVSQSGFAQTFSSTLGNLTDTVSGTLNLELSGISDTQTSLSTQINDLQTRLVQRQQDLTNQYNQINATLQQMPLMLAQINSQLNGMYSSK